MTHIVVVGGGSAGWLVAGLLAAEHGADGSRGVRITLVESPDIPTIGVGEGTWPTMRATLEKIGIPEKDFLRECSASFKQGTRFCGWRDATDGDTYHHPFTAPAHYTALNLVPFWAPHRHEVTFTNAVTTQGHVCDAHLAPKQAETPDYAAVLNYGYHLDVAKFGAMLRRHCMKAYGVRHVLDHVTEVKGLVDGDITAIVTKEHGSIDGDLFVDCTGVAALLIGQHYRVPFVSRRHVLLNDAALAVQVEYADLEAPIASQTISTAQQSGWIWDIGLWNRRGVGYVYSREHASDDEAEKTLRDYVRTIAPHLTEMPAPRKIQFAPGHRECFWRHNCVAVGMAAGFIEPLEASALVMVELSAQMIAEELPANRDVMPIVASRFNEKFLYRWDRVIEFLKLHYVLSHREGRYWQDQRSPASIPDSLKERLSLWRHQVPWHGDFLHRDEIFSSASYQYVLYGMGYETPGTDRLPRPDRLEEAQRIFNENRQKAGKFLQHLPSNRHLLRQILQQPASID